MGPTEGKVARTLAQAWTGAMPVGDWYFDTAENVAARARVPRRRVVHYLEAFVARDLIDRHEIDGWVTYRMRRAFAETLYADTSCV